MSFSSNRPDGLCPVGYWAAPTAVAYNWFCKILFDLHFPWASHFHPRWYQLQTKSNQCAREKVKKIPKFGRIILKLGYMLWFNFILDSIFIFFCLKLIIIHYHTQKQKERKIKPRIKLNHNIYNYKNGATNTNCNITYLKFHLEVWK